MRIVHKLRKLSLTPYLRDTSLTPYPLIRYPLKALGVEVYAPDGFYSYWKDGSGRAGTYKDYNLPQNVGSRIDPKIGLVRPFWPARQ